MLAATRRGVARLEPSAAIVCSAGGHAHSYRTYESLSGDIAGPVTALVAPQRCRMAKKLELGFPVEFTMCHRLSCGLLAAHPIPHTHRRGNAEPVEMEKPMSWKTLLTYITGTVDQELLLRNEYLVTENRILRSQLKGRVRLHDGERKALAEIGQKLGKQALQEVAKI